MNVGQTPWLIKTRDLSFSYSGAKSPSIDGVNLTLRSGTTYGLVGPNASGKSTLLQLLAGILSPSCGEVVRSIQVEQIAYVPQSNALYDMLTVDENIQFFARATGMSRQSARRESELIMGLLGLDEFRSVKVRHCSAGVTKRVSIGVGILGEPHLILLDEPSEALDLASRKKLRSCLEELRAKGVAVVYCTHLGDELGDFAERLIVWENGGFKDVPAKTPLGEGE